MVKNAAVNARDIGDGFDPWVGKIPWKRAWQPSPGFLYGIPWTEEPGGLQSIGRKELDMTEATSNTHTHTDTQTHTDTHTHRHTHTHTQTHRHTHTLSVAGTQGQEFQAAAAACQLP